MKKSLIVVSALLLLGIGAAGTERLRYDTTVFAGGDEVTAGNRWGQRAEYPPCVRGVREDRCIQLYERGVRRSYAAWRAGRAGSAVPTRTVRAYPVCRSRRDDNCVQRPAVRRAARAAQRPALRRAAAVRRPVRARVAAPRAAVRTAAPARRPVQRIARRPVQRAPQQRALQRPAPQTRARPGANTPGM